MSGITTGVGLVSGIDSASLINQLIEVESRPKVLAERRILELQQEQAAFLDLNSRLSGLRGAAEGLRTASVFDSVAVSSTDEDVLTATASPGATLGSFTFLVDRLVSSQQALSRGFTDRNTSAAGIDSITVEPATAQLVSDTDLSLLNSGNGFARGKIVVTDSAGTTETVDLSKSATLNDVLDALNNAENVRISARVSGNRLVVEDTASGAGTLEIRNASGSTAATSLGIDKSETSAGTITGDNIYSLFDNLALDTLNDGAGVNINDNTTFIGSFNDGGTPGDPSDDVFNRGAGDFSITTRDGETYSIRLGAYIIPDGDEIVENEATVATLGQLRDRIELHTNGNATLAFDSTGTKLRIVDLTGSTAQDLEVTDVSGAAVDLGLVATQGGSNAIAGATLEGDAVLATLNSRLASSVRGGAGIVGSELNITDRDGNLYNFNISTDGSISQIIEEIQQETGGRIAVSLNQSKNALVLTDTVGGSGNLIVTGDAADDLGIGTDPGGVSSDSTTGSRVQRQYISEGTKLTQLVPQGVGAGSFTISDSTGLTATINISANDTTFGDIIDAINDTQVNGVRLGVQARINDNGDGIIVEAIDPPPVDPDDDNPTPVDPTTGTLAVTIADVTGNVAKLLNLAGSAENPEELSTNVIDGSFERVIQIEPTDTLDQIVEKVNNAGAPVKVSVIDDGAPISPYRLRFTAVKTGTAGAFSIDAAGADLGLATLTRAQDALAFFGSSDPAQGILLRSTTNSFDNVVDGLRVDAFQASDTPVTLSTTVDSATIESEIRNVLDSFNSVISRIDELTDFNEDTEQAAVLLGDSTVSQLRQELYNTILGPATNTTTFRFLSEVGVRVGAGGLFELDSNRLRDALDQDAEAVKDLFVSRTQEASEDEVLLADDEGNPLITVNNPDGVVTTNNGVTEKLVELLDRYTASGTGVISRRNSNIDTQIEFQNERIEAFDVRLDARRQKLENDFRVMEETLARLQQQQGALASLPGFGA